jgi:hypothetical protein
MSFCKDCKYCLVSKDSDGEHARCFHHLVSPQNGSINLVTGESGIKEKTFCATERMADFHCNPCGKSGKLFEPKTP